MSNRVIVMDGTILDAINLGHTEVAQALFRLARVYKAQIHVSKDVLAARPQADRRLIFDLGVHESQTVLTQRRPDGRPYDVSSYPPSSKGTAELALRLRDNGHTPELLTTNPTFAHYYLRGGGKVAPDVKYINPILGAPPPGNAGAPAPRDVDYTPDLQGRPDYNRARRLVGLPPLNISANGHITDLPPVPPDRGPRTSGGFRTTVTKPGAPPKVVVKPKVYVTPTGHAPDATVDGKAHWPSQENQARVTTGTRARLGEPISAPSDKVHPGHAKGNAIVGGVTLAFRGLNIYVHEMYDMLQVIKLNAAWAKLEPELAKRLDGDPELGALVLAYYSTPEKAASQKDSALTPTATFQTLHAAYGYDKEDALLRDMARASVNKTGQGQWYPVELKWIAPKQRVDVSKLASPFPVSGLATFLSGREELVQVEYKYTAGFDDKKVEKLKVAPNDPQLTFYYLIVPGEIVIVDRNGPRRRTVDVAQMHPALVANPELKDMYVPVVNLDSWKNGLSAAMVWPASNFTKVVFEQQSRPTDHGGLLRNYPTMKLMRWVDPRNMFVLKDFVSLSAQTIESGYKEPFSNW